jgi:hypothetical protein
VGGGDDLALDAVRESLSTDEAFYRKVVWLFQGWDEIDDFLEKADPMTEVMVNAARKKPA